jgi:hypothetical protein
VVSPDICGGQSSSLQYFTFFKDDVVVSRDFTFEVFLIAAPLCKYWVEGLGKFGETLKHSSSIVPFMPNFDPPYQDFLDGIQILGFSLGAHIASYAGQFVQEKLDAKIGRITGLDPAGPYFQWADPVVRLDPSDAAFVDVIHTDGSSSFLTGFGADQAMGHVDFYPNGGQHQPGCLEQQLALDVSEALWAEIGLFWDGVELMKYNS